MSDYKIAIFAGRYILGEGAISELPSLVERFGGRGFFLVCEPLAEQIKPLIGNGTMLVFEEECCEEELARICKAAEASAASVLIGVGGGKIIDAVKITAIRMSLPVIIAPTIAATNACSTCGTVVYTREGVYVKSIYSPANPNVVLVDSRIIANAPVRFFIAGIGDAISTYYEALVCKKANFDNIPGGKQALLPQAAAKMCRDIINEYAEQAAKDAAKHQVTPAFENVLQAITHLSSVGYENTGIAGAHSIHNGLTVFPQTHKFLHGEKVAFGTVAAAYLNEDIKPDEITALCDLCVKLGLPTTFADLDLADISATALLKLGEAIAAAPNAYKETAHSPEDFVEAMKKADALGRARKFTLEPNK